MSFENNNQKEQKMKKKITAIVLSGLLICAAGVAANTLVSFHKDKEDKAEKTEAPVEKGKITVDKTLHDFGTITEEGGKVSTTFTIRNNMEEPILITQVRASCGCTTPAWTKEPIEPGKTGEIEVTYNPKNRIAPFNKSVTVTTNGDPEKIILRIKGVVE